MLISGTIFGPYEVLSPLGAGGMGEVYRARDTRLKRDVALKILSQSFSADSDRLARFQREAEVLASLNHSGVAHVYGLEEADGLQAIVMELVEGETLADRIARGRMPIGEVLPIAKQIADALEAAHERGIVHRDLKPANIKIRPDGAVKVLDFGLAKALEPVAAGSAHVTASPTITSPALVTGAGVLLGTAAYMSPEQAKGRPADKRSDIWAFGCVLYEMLTGQRAFEGEDVADTLANVLKAEPDWTQLPPATPAGVRRVLRRSLQKDRGRRLADIADARLDVEEVIGADDTAAPVERPRSRERVAWVGAVVVLTVAGAAMGWTQRTPLAAPEMRLEVTTPPTVDLPSFDISPDGTQIAFVGTSDGRSQLWVRPLDSATSRPLARTENATLPFWSPDGRSIGFFADGQLKRIDVGTGAVQALADVTRPWGGTWNRDGVILFSPDRSGAIFRIPAAGGQASPVTGGQTRASTTVGHVLPQFLPDGRHFLYVVLGATWRDGGGLFVGDLEGGEARQLVDADGETSAVYTSGHLLFRRRQTLYAQPFDAGRLALSGSAVPLAESVAAVRTSTPPPSTPVTIAYRVGRAGAIRRQLVWFDRSGKELGPLGEPYRADTGLPSMSPDGRQVVVARVSDEGGASDLWLLDTARGLFTRFTSDPFISNFAIWSPDGTRIVFQSNPKGVLDLYQKPVNGVGDQELLVTSGQNKSPSDWSRDGKWLLYRSLDRATGWDLWAMAMNEGGSSSAVVRTPYDERDGQFSPDGRWIAYTSNESGRDEIYVQPFPGPGAKQRISANGGAQVRWRDDGREVFYVDPNEQLTAVPVRSADARTLETGEPVSLFRIRVDGPVQRIGTTGDLSRQQYVVSPDGQRFLVNTALEEITTISPITLILNWAGANQ